MAVSTLLVILWLGVFFEVLAALLLGSAWHRRRRRAGVYVHGRKEDRAMAVVCAAVGTAGIALAGTQLYLPTGPNWVYALALALCFAIPGIVLRVYPRAAEAAHEARDASRLDWEHQQEFPPS